MMSEKTMPPSHAVSVTPHVRRECDARGVVTLTLNRPASFNALSIGMLTAL